MDKSWARGPRGVGGCKGETEQRNTKEIEKYIRSLEKM